MAQFQKTITPKDPANVREKLNRWTLLTDLNVIDMNVDGNTIKLKASKTYRVKGKFRVGLLFLWLAIGIALSAFWSGVAMRLMRAGGPMLGTPEVLPLIVIGCPIGYTIYHFRSTRQRRVVFDVISLGSSEASNLKFKISSSEDFDEVRSDINSLLADMI